MAVLDLQFVGAGAWVSGANAGTPAYPTGLQENDVCYLITHNKPDTVSISAPTDWTLVDTFVGGDTAATAADAGPTRITVFKRMVPSGGLSGTQSLSGLFSGTNSVVVAHIRAYRASNPGAGLAFSEVLEGYERESASTNIGGTVSPAIALAAKDWVLVVTGTPSDATNDLDVTGVSASGSTFGTIANTPSGTMVSGTGNDISAAAFDVAVSAGSSSAGPTITGTANASETGITVAMRIRATDNTSSGSAPTVGAGADVSSHTVNTSFSRTATENDNGSAITARTWKITAGPTGVGTTIGTAAALSWSPTQPGTYTLEYAATNSVGTGTDTMQIVVVAAPTVSAGADVASHTVSTAFSRTATENDNGSAIVARVWSITAGPTGVGTTIGTAAALSWTPTQTGTYTLQYSAENGVGISTDTMSITVVTGGGATAASVRARHAAMSPAGTSHPITFPSGIQAGDSIYVFFVNDEGLADQPTPATTSTSGWATQASWAVEQGGTTNHRATLFRKASAAGGGSDTLTISLPDSQEGAYIVIAVASGGAPLVLTDNRASTSPEDGVEIPLPSHSGLTSDDYLSLVFLGLDANPFPSGGQTIAMPTGYANLQEAEPAASTSSTVAAYSMERSLTDVTVVPPTADAKKSVSWSSADQSIVFHLLIPPGTGGGGTAPPVVDAGADVTNWPVGQAYERIATFDAGDGTFIAGGWEIIAGPSNVGQTANTVGISFTPLVVGTWTFEFTYETTLGVDSDTFTLTSVDTAVNLPAHAGEALWIGDDAGKNHFNLGVGEPGGGTNHTDYTQAQVESGAADRDPEFKMLPNGNVQFRIQVDRGRTSTNTQYPRSECRELNESGGLANWNGSSGRHYMKGRSRVTHVAATKPEVCFFQIHDADSDLMRCITQGGGSGPEGLRLTLKWTPVIDGPESTKVVMTSYALNQWVEWEVEISSGRLRVWLDGVEVLNETGLGRSGCYFKFGCYAQSNTSTENGDASQYFAVEVEKGSIETWHTGYATPTEPVFTGAALDRVTRRFYFANLPARNPVVPNLTWIDDATNAATPFQLTESPAGIPTSISRAETTTETPWWVVLGRWISDPVTTTGKIFGSFVVTNGIYESDAAADFLPYINVYIIGRGTVISTVITNGEIPTSAQAFRWWGGQGSGSGEITLQPGDQLIVDIGYRANNTAATSYTGTLHYGGTTAPDLEIPSTALDRPSWVEFEMSPGMAFDENYEPPPDGILSGRMLLSV